MQSSYEITIGAQDNTKLILRKAVDGELVTIKEQELYHSLNCDLELTFWVTWTDGIVRAGRNHPYVTEFLYWEDPDENYPKIHALSLTSSEETPALWSFGRDQGEVF